MKKLILLGSTGSIGTQTLDVVRAYPDLFQISALAAGKNTAAMEAQIREFHPGIVCMWSEDAASDLRVRTADLNVEIVCGMEGLLRLASLEEGDIFLNAVVGMIGIRPTLAAIAAGKTIALANKETLVTAGHLIMPAAKKAGVPILPVDSEHSAIFQCLNGEPSRRISRILLTCSGGTFRGRKTPDLKGMHAADALKNPNWDMGAKVTIDSASLVNKGLEVLEAKWLFDVDVDDITVVVQPKSIVHSAVAFVDGTVMAQLAMPDMRLPIQYALTYPDRLPLNIPPVDLFELAKIDFLRPDTDTFRGLPLAYRAGHAGGSLPTVFNAANEEAVSWFMKDQIEFLDLYRLIESAMDAHTVRPDPSLEEILEIEKQTRAFVREQIEKICPASAARRKIHYAGRVIKKTAGSALSVRFLLFFIVFFPKGHIIINRLHGENSHILYHIKSSHSRNRNCSLPCNIFYCSIVRISTKPVTSKISMISELTLQIFMLPCLFIVFWAESSTRSPAEEI